MKRKTHSQSLWLESKKYRFLLLLLILQVFGIQQAHARFPNFIPTDTYYFNFYDGPTFENGQIGGLPYFTIYMFVYNTWGQDDYMNKATLSYKIEGEDTNYTDLFTYEKRNLTWRLSKGGIHGAVEDWDQQRSSDYYRNYIRWYIPDRITGKRVRIKLTYQWAYDFNNQDVRTYEFTRDIPNINKPAINFERQGSDKVVCNWTGASPQGNIMMKLNGQVVSTQAARANGSYTFENVKVTEDAKIDWEFKYTVNSHGSDKLNYVQKGTQEYVSMKPPTQFAQQLDICSRTVRLTWNNPVTDDGVVYILRKQGDSGALSKLAELYGNEREFEDLNLPLDQKFTYILTKLPEGVNWNQYTQYESYSQLSVTTSAPLITLTQPRVTELPKGNNLTYLKINWDLANWCSDATVQLIKRVNTTGREKVIPVTPTQTEYIDEETGGCVTYEYLLRVTNIGRVSESPITTHTINQATEMTLLEATKGVYNDRVELKWKTNNPLIVDEYNIYRKLLSDPATSYELKATIKNSSSIVTWRDETAVSGQYYSYKVESVTTCGDNNTIYSFKENIGYVQSYGTVSGRISYKGGTNVSGVAVRLQRMDNEELSLTNRSLYFGGQGYAIATYKNALTFNPTNGLTFQAYVCPAEQLKEGNTRVIAEQEGNLKISLEGTNLVVRTGGQELTFPFAEYAMKYTQLSVTAQGSKFTLYIDGVKAQETDGAMSGYTSSTQMYLGASSSKANGFVGYIDEVRIWTTALTAQNVANNYNRYLQGTEKDLFAYWQFDEELDSHFFDLAHKDYTYNENNGILSGVTSSENIPTQEQLALMAYTDGNGNYLIRGIPYALEGSTYAIVPTYQTHQFEPAQQLRHIGGGGLSVLNSIDFSDVSSFKISGTVEFESTNFPVEGAQIYIDGNAAMKDGEFIKTTREGRFTVDVPIGEHFVQIKMDNHVFDNQGRWPVENGARFDFQHDVSGLTFIDKTLVKMAGRVSGGRVQNDKPVGFGFSTNNLGRGFIQLSPEKEEYNLTKGEDRPLSIHDKYISNEVTIRNKAIQIFPNEETGEFVAYVPPLKYAVKQVTAGKYIIPSDQLTALDLTNWENKEEIQEVKVLVDGNQIQKVDTFTYNVLCKYNYIEPIPTVQVTQIGSKYPTLFGDSIFNYQDKQTLPLMIAKRIDDDESVSDSAYYAFNAPAFSQLTQYRQRIEVWEQYENIDKGGKIDRLPFVDGKLRINNSFGLAEDNMESQTMIDQNTVELELDSTGVTVYTFQGGLPNISVNESNPAENFRRALQIHVVTNAGRTISWPEEAMSGYLLGAMPTGNNFVTTGPDKLLAILRDPPGSNSFTSMESGTSFTSSTSSTLSSSNSAGGNVVAHLGIKTSIGKGIGVVKTDEFEVVNDMTSGQTATSGYTDAETLSTTYSTSQIISTSADPAYVGAMGDVFVGLSTNVVYGAAQAIEVAPVTMLDEIADGTEFELAGQQFAIGKMQSFRMNVDGKTFFVYDQNHITNYLIPNMKMLRNQFLTRNADPNFIPADTLSKTYYLTTLEADDERYGSDNDNLNYWADDYNFWYGSEQHTPKDTERFSKLSHQGSSYRRYPMQRKGEVDSIRYFNKQIEMWEYYLSLNEQAKVKANVKKDNISFSAGVGEITRSETSCESKETNFTYEVEEDITFSEESHITYAGLGGGFNLEMHTVTNIAEDTGTGEEKCTTFSYTLSDGDQGDYQSIDVYEAENSSHSPIFKRVGGQTACPYEGESITSYYRPGTVIDKASQRIEAPKITVKKSIISGVTGGRDAVFELYLQNETEVGADVVYSLQLDDASNPNGAILQIDGQPVTADGRSFLVPANGTLTKTLVVRQSRTDVLDYENIRLILASGCQYDPTDDVDDIYDDVTISAFFQPSSSPLALSTENNIHVVNSITGTTLPIVIKDYDRNYKDFAGIALEYRAEADANWTTQIYFANTKEEYERTSGAKDSITGPEIAYAWDMSSLIDRNYQLRARSISKTATGAFIADNALDPVTLTKDISSPKQMGNPLPADGILLPGGDILLNFNEDIQKNMVTRYNFHIEGELNGQEVSQGVGMEFNNNQEYAYTESTFDLSQKPFTVEFWMKRNLGEAGVVYSQGSGESCLNISFDEQDFLHVTYNKQDIRSKVAIPERGWMHIAVTYNLDTRKLSAYVAAQNVAERDRKIIDDYFMGDSYLALTGKINLGKNISRQADPQIAHLANGFKGAMNELRVWTKNRMLNEILTQNSVTISEREIGLIGYWPMNEGEGTLAKDKVASHHIKLNTGWYVYPKGCAAAFNGTDQALKLNTSVIRLTKDNNYTISYWFKADAANKNVSLYAYTKKQKTVAGADTLVNVLSIGMDENSLLSLYNGNDKYTLSQKNFADNQWHNFALSVNRVGKAQVYVDKNMLFATDASKLPALCEGNTWLGAFAADSAFFKGSIDEFRIWSSALTQDQIDRDANVRQKGDETGLRAYYPFDAYIADEAGYSSLQPSLGDQIDQADILPGGDAQAFGASPLSENAMNIREARKMTAIDMFDYTVSDKSVLITLTENKERIEGCVIDFTVDGIEDLFGNKQTSPVKWSTLVSQNTLKWGETEISKEKKVLNPLKFTVNIINNKGTKDDFTLENLPSWINVSQVAGTLQPMESKTLTFTIDESLNIGLYNEIIYLKGSSNLTSLLKLSVKVTGEKPDWKVNPSNYDYSMNIVGMLKIEDIVSTDPEDIVAAFSKDECIGIARPEYVPSHDFYALFMTLYNNKPLDEQVYFKVWDASKGRIYPTVTPRQFAFENNKVTGNFENPLQLNAVDEIQLDWNLHKGWNWVSLNITNDQLSQPGVLLDSLKHTLITLKDFENEIKYQSEIGWYGTLENLAVGKAYKVNMAQADTLALKGKMAAPKDSKITLAKGWNLVGYVPTDIMTINEALSNLSPENGDVIKNQTDFAMYYNVNGGWMGSLKYMKPGEGYMYQAGTQKTFVYPSFTSSAVHSAPAFATSDESQPLPDNWKVNESKYPSNMSMIAELYSDEVLLNPEQFVIGAFVGDECRGLGKIVDKVYFVTIQGNRTGEEVSFKAIEPATGKIYEIDEKAPFCDDIVGSMWQPYSLHLSTSPTNIGSINEQDVIVYPNPVKDKLRFKGVPERIRMIRVADMTGRTMIYLKDWISSEGVDVSALAEGAYILLIETESYSHEEKFIKSNLLNE